MMMAIFGFSSKNSRVSDKMSKGLINVVVSGYEKIFNISLNNQEIQDKLNFIVRKTAHFTEYFILGLFLYLFIEEFKITSTYWYVALIGLVFAATDEFHQLFVSGRTAKITDVLIDTSGIMLSLIIMKVYEVLNGKRKKKTKN
jgi:VanZ family protein